MKCNIHVVSYKLQVDKLVAAISEGDNKAEFDHSDFKTVGRYAFTCCEWSVEKYFWTTKMFLLDQIKAYVKQLYRSILNAYDIFITIICSG